MKSDIRIAISGKSGCGNTTISRLVAEGLNLRFINFTFRSLAEERNISFEEVLRLAESDDFWDREVDSRQVALARSSGANGLPAGCVLGSRLAIWMLVEADLKVYLRAQDATRARRIQAREGGLLSEVSAFTEKRDKQDHARYLRLYHINNDEYVFADLVVDTDDKTPEEIAGIIVARAGALGSEAFPGLIL
jgi:cytidylate kinase